jgi:hypothetical protein
MDLQKTKRPVNANKATILSNRAYRGTEAKLRMVVEHYAKNGRLVRACNAAGIDHATHYRRMQSDPTYRAAVEEAEQQVAQEVEDSVYDMAIGGEIQAAALLLKRFRPELYRERASLEVSGSIDLGDRLREARNRVITLRNEHLPTGT